MKGINNRLRDREQWGKIHFLIYDKLFLCMLFSLDKQEETGLCEEPGEKGIANANIPEIKRRLVCYRN